MLHFGWKAVIVVWGRRCEHIRDAGADRGSDQPRGVACPAPAHPRALRSPRIRTIGPKPGEVDHEDAMCRAHAPARD